MQERPSVYCLQEKDAIDAVAESARRYLPAPHTAPELAAMESALNAPRSGGSVSRARILVGTAAIAVALTVPDLSLGAMGSPYMRIDLGEPVTGLPEAVWIPSARPVGPVYKSIGAADGNPSEAVGFARELRVARFAEDLPLEFLATGSQRLDLGIGRGLSMGEVEVPGPQPMSLVEINSVAIAPRPPREPLIAARDITTLSEPLRPRRAGLVEIEQIAASRAARTEMRSGSRPAESALALGTSSDRSIAAASESIETAFAGAIDASGAVRESISATERDSAASQPSDIVIVPEANAFPIPAPDPAIGASAAAQAELDVKTRLDARVNGVLAGSVEFRQLDGTIAIRLGSVLDMLRDRFSADEFSHLRSGRSSDAFVTLAQLQDAGIPISYNPAYDEVEFGIDYDDAPNAGKVQVEQIGAPTIGSDRVGMEQIPRR